MKTLLATTAAFALAASAALAENWDMPMAYPESNYHTQTGEAFAQCVKEGTGGEIDITVHSNGSLFKGNEIKRAVQTGQASIGERLLSAHQNENAVFGFDSVPFLATNFDQAQKLWAAAKPEIEKTLDEQNLVLLYSVPWPPQGLYFKKEVNSVEDMQGVKFRSYNPATAKLAELTGMVPVQIEAAEISQAFATGVAESMISSGATGYEMKVWEQLDHFYPVNAWMPRNTVFINKDVWNDLDDAKKNVIRGCASLAAFAGRAKAQWYTDYTVKGLAANGMTVEEPSDKLKSQLKEIGQKMADEWEKQAGEQGKKILKDYTASLN